MSERRAYDTESYALGELAQNSIYNMDNRIFHYPGYEYDNVKSVKKIDILENKILMGVELASGKPANLAITIYSDTLIRLNFSINDLVFSDKSDMIETLEASIDKVEAINEGEFAIGEKKLVIQAEPFNLLILNKDGKVIMELAKDIIAGDYASAPLGVRALGEEAEPYFSWHIQNEEKFFGLGEKWNKVEKSFTKSTIWNVDTCGSNTTDLCYKSYPMLLSTKGWGMMVHTTFKTMWEIGTFSYQSGSVLSSDDNLDIFFFFAPSLKGLINEYTKLTGRPGLAPKWALGLWMSRCMFTSIAESEESINGMIERGIPFDVTHLDPLWMKTHYYFKIGVDACDFVRNDEGYPNLPNVLKSFMDKGISTSFWINPYLPEGSPIYQEALEKGYMLKSLKGGLARLDRGEPVGMIDFTNPEATKWWKGYLIELIKDGASALKPDYGDRMPEDAVGFDGRTGKELHNIYMHYYSKAAFDATVEAGGDAFVWRRSGYVGSQRMPGTWAGDTQVTWEAMRCCLRGGLSAGFAGEGLWASDIGGFVGEIPSPELYIRWSQWGILSPLARYHGTCPKEPWNFGDLAVDIVRKYAKLRYALMPYILKMHEISHETGVPIMRHLKLEFEDEPNVETIDDQFMLGDSIMVAPILNEGQRGRYVYLPEGNWYGLFDKKKYEGRTFVYVDAPIEDIPLFVRGGAEIPYYKEIPMNLKTEIPDNIAIAKWGE